MVAVGLATAVIASTLTGGDDPNAHTMPNGQTMNGTMPSGTHQMDDGSTMNDTDMEK